MCVRTYVCTCVRMHTHPILYLWAQTVRKKKRSHLTPTQSYTSTILFSSSAGSPQFWFCFLFGPGGLFFLNGIWARSECARCSLFFCLVSEPSRGAPGALFFVCLESGPVFVLYPGKWLGPVQLFFFFFIIPGPHIFYDTCWFLRFITIPVFMILFHFRYFYDTIFSDTFPIFAFFYDTYFYDTFYFTNRYLWK